MPAGINYHVHIRTSYSKDGEVLLWCIDPQSGQQTVKVIRKMTFQEMKNHVAERKQFGLKPWLHKYVLEREGL